MNAPQHAEHAQVEQAHDSHTQDETSHSFAPGHPEHVAPVAPASNKAVKFVENVLFNVRWTLLVFYLGLVAVLGLYAFAFVKEVIELFPQAIRLSALALKVEILDFVDTVMVGNLVKLIVTGSYHSFVSKAHGRANEAVSSGQLKIKISTSILVICSIALLRNFITASGPTIWDQMLKDLAIFGMLLVCSLVLSVIEYLHVKGEVLEHGMDH